MYQSAVTFQTCESDEMVNIDICYTNDVELNIFTKPLQTSYCLNSAECGTCPQSNGQQFTMPLSKNNYIIRGTCYDDTKPCSYRLQICGCKSVPPTQYPLSSPLTLYPSKSLITIKPTVYSDNNIHIPHHF